MTTPRCVITLVIYKKAETLGVLILYITNVITCLGIVTVSDGVEICGGVNKTLVEEAIGVAPVH